MHPPTDGGVAGPGPRPRAGTPQDAAIGELLATHLASTGWDGTADIYLIYLVNGTPRLRPLPVEVHPSASSGLPPQAFIHSVAPVMAILAADPRFRLLDGLRGAAVLYDRQARTPGPAGTSQGRVRLMCGISLDGAIAYEAVLLPGHSGVSSRTRSAGAPAPGEVPSALRALLRVITESASQADRSP